MIIDLTVRFSGYCQEYFHLFVVTTKQFVKQGVKRQHFCEKPPPAHILSKQHVQSVTFECMLAWL